MVSESERFKPGDKVIRNGFHSPVMFVDFFDKISGCYFVCWYLKGLRQQDCVDPGNLLPAPNRIEERLTAPK